MYSLITDGTEAPSQRPLWLGVLVIIWSVSPNFLAIVTTMYDNDLYVWAMPRRSGDEESNYVFDCVFAKWCYVC